MKRPVFTRPDHKFGQIGWRRYALERVADRKHPKIRGITNGNRIGVFFGREDLSAGLVGQDVDGINGYDPQTATDLMAGMLMDVK